MGNVFISHRGADTSDAQRLGDAIRAAGHNVWLDVLEIGIGDSVVKQINEGLEGATYVVVCYSSSGVEAPWMGREWMSALAGQLNGKGIKLLPVRLTGGGAPAILEDIKPADLVKDWDGGMLELLRAIR